MNPTISTNPSIYNEIREDMTYNLAFKGDVHDTGRLMKEGGCHKARANIDHEQNPDKY